MSGRVARIVEIENACVERYETALDYYRNTDTSLNIAKGTTYILSRGE
jgi:hypothetical protein